MTTVTATPSYWLNWRFLLCAIWILIAVVASAFIIWKYEGSSKSGSHQRENRKKRQGLMYKDEAWKTCHKAIHPLWLLAYRLIAFAVLLSLLVADAVTHSARIFFFYTQWTFTLVTIYFGLGSLVSIYGCIQGRKEVDGERVDSADAERSTALRETASLPGISNGLSSHGETHDRKAAGFWGYAFQILFQICAGAVVLTDCVYWLVLYPFLTDKNYKLHFLVISLHSFNAIFLLGDVILNNLRFPFFRVAYFVLWTCTYIVVQWIIHMCITMWWPYPFLDISSQFAPVWYLGLGVLLIPFFGIFALIVRLKKCLLSRLEHN